MKAIEVGRAVGDVLDSETLQFALAGQLATAFPGHPRPLGEWGSKMTAPETEKPPCVFTRATVTTRRRYLSWATYFKRMKGINREVSPHRLAPVCWEEEQPSELFAAVCCLVWRHSNPCADLLTGRHASCNRLI
jgi:hypothetical protein